MSPEDVDLVIHATSTPDDLFGTGPQASLVASINVAARRGRDGLNDVEG